MNRILPTRVALSCLWRTWVVNAAMTARGMQQLGLVFVLAPALRYLYPDKESRAKAFARYIGHSNTHAFMLPCYVGLLLSFEKHVSAGQLPESMILSLRQTLATTLSALGDGFFSGAVRTFWALVTICLIFEDCLAAAAGFTITLLVLLWVFRVTGFFYCLNHGISSLPWLKMVDLISWTERVKIFNGLLIALVLLIQLGQEMSELALGTRIGILLFIPAASWVVSRLHISRMILWIIALAFFVLAENGYLPF